MIFTHLWEHKDNRKDGDNSIYTCRVS